MGEILARESLVNHGGQRLTLAVYIRNGAARAQRNLHHAEVIAHHTKGVDLRFVTHRDWRPALERQAVR